MHRLLVTCMQAIHAIVETVVNVRPSLAPHVSCESLCCKSVSNHELATLLVCDYMLYSVPACLQVSRV